MTTVVLEAGSFEEHLWLPDAIDKLLDERLRITDASEPQHA